MKEIILLLTIIIAILVVILLRLLLLLNSNKSKNNNNNNNKNNNLHILQAETIASAMPLTTQGKAFKGTIRMANRLMLVNT